MSDIEKVRDDFKDFIEKHELPSKELGFLVGVFSKHTAKLEAENERLKKAEDIAYKQGYYDGYKKCEKEQS